MSTGEFINLVEQMRTAQKAYKRCMSDKTKHEMKVLETAVDNAIASRNERMAQAMNPTLF